MISQGVNQAVFGWEFWVLFLVLAIGGILIAYYFLGMRSQKKWLLQRAGDLVMLEVRVPKESPKKEDEPFKSFQDLLKVGEQFFSSLSGLYKGGWKGFWEGQPILSFEIIAKGKEIIFYVGVPTSYKELVEKQILSFYPNAQIEESQDFRIYDPNLSLAVGTLHLTRKFIFPIKTYEDFGSDPLANLTNVLSKMGENSKAAIQILIQPASHRFRIASQVAEREISQGRPVSLATTWWGRILDQLWLLFRKPEQKPQLMPSQETNLKLIQEKGNKPGFLTQIRLIVFSPTTNEAELHLKNIFAAFSQFSSPERNGFRLIKPVNSKKFLTHFILRNFWPSRKMLLNTAELSSLFHLPNYLIDTPGIRWFLAKRAAPPTNLPIEGLILGENIFRGEKALVKVKEDDRRRHLYVIGMTGTGKSTLLESMALQDIRRGRGLVFLDPHGTSIEEILARFPKERAEDLILFDPADTEHPLGLNLLEWETPEEKDFLVQELVNIFYKLFDPHQVGFIGPQFEHWMRNAALTLMEGKEPGTLIEIPRLFTDDEFREEKVKGLTNRVVQAFWTQQMAKTAEFHKSEMYNYFISKFGRFMTNEMMRNIIGQTHSSFNFPEIMEKQKVLLVNLSKGKIGEVNSALLGMILVAKFFTAALQRQKKGGGDYPDFYLYVDEFQSFATDTFSQILSEARKYRLNLTIANQYIAQIPEAIRDAIIGNVGTLISFRVGVPDAEFMAKEFAPIFNPQDLANIESFNAYIRLLVDNTPTRPFSLRTIKDSQTPAPKLKEALKSLSALKYGRARPIVVEEINERMPIFTEKVEPSLSSAKT